MTGLSNYGFFRGFGNFRKVEVPHHEHGHEPRTRLFFQAATHKSAHAQQDLEQLLLREPTPKPLTVHSLRN